MNLKPSAFLDNLGTDFVAVDQNGNVLTRASDEASARQAAPDAYAYLDAKGVKDASPAAPVTNALNATNDPLARIAADVAPEIKEDYKKPVADGSAFDHDGDGKVGGSKPKTKKAAAKK